MLVLVVARRKGGGQSRIWQQQGTGTHPTIEMTLRLVSTVGLSAAACKVDSNRVAAAARPLARTPAPCTPPQPTDADLRAATAGGNGRSAEGARRPPHRVAVARVSARAPGVGSASSRVSRWNAITSGTWDQYSVSCSGTNVLCDRFRLLRPRWIQRNAGVL